MRAEHVYVRPVVVPSGREYDADREQGHWSDFRPGEVCWVVWRGGLGDYYIDRVGEYRTEKEAEARAGRTRLPRGQRFKKVAAVPGPASPLFDDDAGGLVQ
jgi:hypothetical protein